MHAGQDPQDLQDHRIDQGVPHPLLGRGSRGRRSLNLGVQPVEIAIPAGSAYVGIVRLAVGSLARAAGVDEERVDDIRIAVSEACTNAVLTNDEARSTDPIVISWVDQEDRLVVEVGDRGGNPHLEAPGTDSQGFSSRLVMSVALLREMVDELSFDPREGGGTTTRLTFLRNS